FLPSGKKPSLQPGDCPRLQHSDTAALLNICNLGLLRKDPGLGDVVVDRHFTPQVCAREAKEGDYVRYHYNATFVDGKTFDSRWACSGGRLIAGIDKGLQGMCVNERTTITVPPHLAYGSAGAGKCQCAPGNPPVGAWKCHPGVEIHLLDVWNKADLVVTKTISTPKDCKRSVMRTDFWGEGWLIKGMDEGLMGMCVGRDQKYCSPALQSLRRKKDQVQISPPRRPWCFDVLLVDIHNSKDNLTIENQVLPESCTRRKSVSGDYVRYHYNGTFLNGRNSTYNTYIGMGYVITGMDQALIGVCIGEKRRVIIPPHLAYGEQGAGTIHVIDFHNPNDTVNIQITHKPEACKEVTAENDLVRYHYNCNPGGRTKLFSSDLQDAVLGSDKVIDGLDAGLRDMCVGEKRVITVPPSPWPRRKRGAVLVFDIELVSFEKGVPPGYLFVWLEESPTDLFDALDVNKNEVFGEFIKLQVAEGKDGVITADELKLKVDEDKEREDARHEEL
uniref:peptidylprolyl isomerase n=1 Tax=Cyclopterus lumpus TaxID=8103 RepID=A0A8C2WH11_CYCLU